MIYIVKRLVVILAVVALVRSFTWTTSRKPRLTRADAVFHLPVYGFMELALGITGTVVLQLRFGKKRLKSASVVKSRLRTIRAPGSFQPERLQRWIEALKRGLLMDVTENWTRGLAAKKPFEELVEFVFQIDPSLSPFTRNYFVQFNPVDIERVVITASPYRRDNAKGSEAAGNDGGYPLLGSLKGQSLGQGHDLD